MGYLGILALFDEPSRFMHHASSNFLQSRHGVDMSYLYELILLQHFGHSIKSLA
jgi:hypothetical protein